MRRAVGALTLAAVLLGCSSGSQSDDTLAPVGSAPMATSTTVAGTTATGPVGSGAVRITVQLSGIVEELVLDRSTVAVADLDQITLDATCTAIDGGDGYVVSVVDVRRLVAGHQLVSAVLRVTGATGPVEPGAHEARLELGTSEQDIVRFDGVMVLDAGAASGTFELTSGAGAVATGSFGCGEDLASIPTTTTTTIPVVPATEVAATTDVAVTEPPAPTVPEATS